MMNICLLRYHGVEETQYFATGTMSKDQKDEIIDAKLFLRWLLEGKVDEHARILKN